MINTNITWFIKPEDCLIPEDPERTVRANTIRRNHNKKVMTIKQAIIEKDYKTLVRMLTITEHSATSKMAGKVSLSSSIKLNRFCQARHSGKCSDNNRECVCEHCFADSINDARPTVKMSTMRNSLILTNIEIPVNYWKYFRLAGKKLEMAKTGFRIESLGDVANITQVQNYANMVKYYSNLPFTAWSKNWFTWYKGCLESGKPENLIYIHSSTYINTLDLPPQWFYDQFVDYTFTVYRMQYAIENGIVCNCCTPFNKSRQCNRDCNECYSKGNFKHRRELLR